MFRKAWQRRWGGGESDKRVLFREQLRLQGRFSRVGRPPPERQRWLSDVLGPHTAHLPPQDQRPGFSSPVGLSVISKLGSTEVYLVSVEAPKGGSKRIWQLFY